jgi:murein DD-endopeptidase MepM/ murein hydrolase activator NlpD
VRLAARALAITLLVLAAFAAGGCFSDEPVETRVFVDGTVVDEGPGPAGTMAAAAATTSPVRPLPFSPTVAVSDLDPSAVRGFVMPIADGCLPSRDEVMPNAPRIYRNGVHEGVDFYHGDVCTAIERGTPVRAMYAGVIVRVDHDYQDITPAEGIDHGNGVQSRYAHLEDVAPGLAIGVAVVAGQPVGGIGESGTPESVTAPGTELHLHVEVRVDNEFLGSELAPPEVRALWQQLFEPPVSGEAP